MKFTNALVAHAHLALAGLVTCFNLALLNLLTPDRPVVRGFWLWQGALALQITALFALGWTEYDDPAALFLSRDWSQTCYSFRLAAGAIMWGLALFWLLQKPRATAKTTSLLPAMSLPKIARILALVAGSLDFCTGLGLVFLPRLVLPLMHVNVPEGEALVYLRFVGAFVGAVGACYLWALVRGGLDRLRSTLELTILFRLSAGAFSATAIALGWLSVAWVSVPATDFFLVVFQFWLVKKLAVNHDVCAPKPAA